MSETAVLWGSEPPAYSIGWCQPMWPGDSGFSIVFADAPDPDEMDDVPLSSLPDGVFIAHLGCLLDDHPEIGRGLDIARAFGAADLDENDEWIGRLEDD